MDTPGSPVNPNELRNYSDFSFADCNIAPFRYNGYRDKRGGVLSTMLLQLAVDCFTLEEAVGIVREVGDLVDIVEAGTPLILREGVRAIEALRSLSPDLRILADMKIVDGAEYESRLAFDAGADIVTVLAAAEDKTIRLVIETASKLGREVMADMIGIRNLGKRAKQIEALGADYLCVHRATDLLSDDSTPPQELREVKLTVRHAKIAVAGGVNARTLGPIVREGPDVVIVGNFITKSSNLRTAALQTRALL
jgi:3-hexulose-6-phosphate synthase